MTERTTDSRRVVYRTPTLSRYGAMSELTASGTGQSGENVNNPTRTPPRP
jgi:hypothetical protein